jgi:hypothetical protein
MELLEPYLSEWCLTWAVGQALLGLAVVVVVLLLLLLSLALV